jgi:TPR repeat protein
VRSLQCNNYYYYNYEAFEYVTKAAELGDAAAHACLGLLYYGELSVEKERKRQCTTLNWQQLAILPLLILSCKS